MPIEIAVALGAIAAIVCTVLSLILITPDKKRETLNPFFQFIHDLFNFKWLILEKLLKVLYILSTLLCVCIGFFFLFAGESVWGSFQSLALQGLLLMIIGPIVIRLTYELLMMFVLVVKNVIEINNKLKAPETETAAVEAPPKPEYVYCSHCGTRCTKGDSTCPNCGHPLS